MCLRVQRLDWCCMGESNKQLSNARRLTFPLQRESFVSDFTTGWSAALNQNFLVSTWSETHDGVPKTIQYTAANVYGYNSGLGLKTSAYPAGSTGSVKTAEIATKRTDILYGSFRMRATVPSVSGVHFRSLNIRRLNQNLFSGAWRVLRIFHIQV